MIIHTFTELKVLTKELAALLVVVNVKIPFYSVAPYLLAL